ncbi:hypothetical protein [Ramlibacter sp. WS9]|nr:hypothetical protein [Ramlibacter sp. WS9]
MNYFRALADRLPSTLSDFGDAICCAAVIVAGITGLVALYWVVCHMPLLR